MRSEMVATMLLLAIVGIQGQDSSGQQRSTNDAKNVKISRNSYFVDCGHGLDETSHSVRSRNLQSPTTKRVAFAESHAEFRNHLCANSSRLYVRDVGGKFRVVFMEEPVEMQLGNGIRLIDWSPDGTYLLFDVLQWQYGSDADTSNRILLYNAAAHYFKEVPIDIALRGLTDGCFAKTEPLGFTKGGSVLISITAVQGFGPEGEPLNPTCKPRQATFVFNSATNEFREEMSPQVITHSGRAGE